MAANNEFVLLNEEVEEAEALYRRGQRTMWHTDAYSDCNSFAHADANCEPHNNPNSYTQQHTEAYSDT